MKYMDKLSNIINNIAIYICTFLGLNIFFSINFAIFARYFSEKSFTWPEEVARYSMAVMTFIAASIIIKNENLVTFKFFQNIISHKLQAVLNLIIKIAMILFMVIFLYNGLLSISFYKNIRSASTNISTLWPILGIIIGGIFMLIQLLHSLLKGINALKLNKG